MSREIMQQALDALKYHTEQTYPFHQTNVAIEALQKALAQPEHANPAAKHWHDLYKSKCQEFHDKQAALGTEIVALEEELAELKDEQLAKPEQKPVAWLHPDKKIDVVVPTSLTWFDKPLPLYTAAPRKECEIEQARREERRWCHQLVWDYGFSRVDNEDVQEACSILAKQILARSKK